MGNFNKKYIIKEAESILEEFNKKTSKGKNDKNQLLTLKIQAKKQKRKTVFWQICTVILFALLLTSYII